MSAAEATPSSTMRITSRAMATPNRELAKPGESFTTIGVFPRAATRAVSGDVVVPSTTSIRVDAGTGLKNAGRRYLRAGRAAPPARSRRATTYWLRAGPRPPLVACRPALQRASGWASAVLLPANRGADSAHQECFSHSCLHRRAGFQDVSGRPAAHPVPAHTRAENRKGPRPSGPILSGTRCPARLGW